MTDTNGLPANIIEALEKLKLTSSQLRIIFAIWLHQSEPISGLDITQYTGIHESLVRKDLRELVSYKLVNRQYDGTKIGRGMKPVTTINTNTSEWVLKGITTAHLSDDKGALNSAGVSDKGVNSSAPLDEKGITTAHLSDDKGALNSAGVSDKGVNSSAPLDEKGITTAHLSDDKGALNSAGVRDKGVNSSAPLDEKGITTAHLSDDKGALNSAGVRDKGVNSSAPLLDNNSQPLQYSASQKDEIVKLIMKEAKERKFRDTIDEYFREKIDEFVEEYHSPVSWVTDAFNIAERKVPKWVYVAGILEDWQTYGKREGYKQKKRKEPKIVPLEGEII